MTAEERKMLHELAGYTGKIKRGVYTLWVVVMLSLATNIVLLGYVIANF